MASLIRTPWSIIGLTGLRCASNHKRLYIFLGMLNYRELSPFNCSLFPRLSFRHVPRLLCLAGLISLAGAITPTWALELSPPVLESASYPELFSEPVRLFNDGSYEAALKRLQQIEQTGQAAKELDRLYFLRGLCLTFLRQYVPAESAYTSSITERSSNSDVIYFQGLNRLANGKPDSAIEAFNEALWFGKLTLVKPEDVYYRIAEIYLEADQALKAEETLQQAISANQGYVPARRKLSELLIEQGKRAEAIAMLRQATASEPDNPEVKLDLAKRLLVAANKLLDKGDIEEAKAITEGLLKDKDDSAKFQDPAFPVYLTALLRTGELELAEKSLTRALKANPNDAELQRVKRQLNVEQQANITEAERAASDPEGADNQLTFDEKPKRTTVRVPHQKADGVSRKQRDGKKG